MSISTSKKVLIPLATLLAAGAIAVGSGATFTSTTSNTISAVTSGTLEQANDKAGKAIFNLDNVKPGDELKGSLKLTNTGTLPAAFSLTEVASTNGFSAEHLKLSIVDSATQDKVYEGTFGGLVDGTKTDLGQMAAGEATTYVFTVTLDKNTPNTDQGKTATATYQWDSVQLDEKTTTNQ